MASNQTTNYGLHVWEPEDDFLRSEFNENNETIDTAIAEAVASGLKINYGSYTGDGTSSRTILFPFAPILVILVGNFQSRCTAVLVRGQTAGEMDSSTTGYTLTWSSDSVTLSGNPLVPDAYCNEEGISYRYLGIG